MPAALSCATQGPPDRILVRGVNWLGDAVMTTPALQRLRERFPAARITLLTLGKLAPLWQGHPSLDAVFSPGQGEGVFSVGRRLRDERFQLALILPNSARSALECWLARIPRRVGLTRGWRDGLLTDAIAPRPGQTRMRKRTVREVRALLANPVTAPVLGPGAHQLHDYLELAAAVGANPAPLAPLVQVAASEIEQSRRLFPEDLRGAGLAEPGAPLLLGLNPGAEYGPAKRWPAAHFVAAARELSARLSPCRWLVFGGQGDAERCREIARGIGPGVINLAGQTTLRELMALLRQCRVLVTNDTGPMHLAAALGTPVVALFGSTSAALTGPGLPGDPRHRLLRGEAPCAPCFRRECPVDFRCLSATLPDRVVEAVQAVVGRHQAGE